MKTGAFAILLLAVTVATATADVKVFLGGSPSAAESWHDPNLWDPYGEPDAYDRVIIPFEKSCWIYADDAYADTVEVQGGLGVYNGCVLTLDNDNDNVPGQTADNSIIGQWGTFHIGPANFGVQGVVRFEQNDHEFTGTGDIEMTGGTIGGRIEIAVGVSLINSLSPQSGQTGQWGSIWGAGIIQGDEDTVGNPPQHGTLVNNGGVRATGLLLLGPHTLLEDSPGAFWQVRGSSCELTIMTSATSLEGDFNQLDPYCPTQCGLQEGCAAFVFHADVKTCGTYSRSGTKVWIIGAGTTFEYAGFSDGWPRACGNPGSVANPSLPTSCTNPFVVSATTNLCSVWGVNSAVFGTYGDSCIYCRADLTHTAVSGSPGYGVPNYALSNDDYFYFLNRWNAGDLLVADFTHTGVAGSPGFGVPNGVVNNDDYFFYLALFSDGCW